MCIYVYIYIRHDLASCGYAMASFHYLLCTTKSVARFFLASPSGSSMTAANKVCIHVDLAGCDQFNNQNLLRDMGVWK